MPPPQGTAYTGFVPTTLQALEGAPLQSWVGGVEPRAAEATAWGGTGQAQPKAQDQLPEQQPCPRPPAQLAAGPAALRL